MQKKKLLSACFTLVFAILCALSYFAVKTLNKSAAYAAGETQITQTVYWGVQGTKIVFDNKSVSGSPSGAFSGEFGPIMKNNDEETTDYYDFVLCPGGDAQTLRELITTAEIAGEICLKVYNSFFNRFTNLEKIENFSNLKVSDKTETAMYMFGDCKKLGNLDVSSWDTSNVTRIGGIFQGCSSMTEIDVTSWDTSKVQIYQNMFNGCTLLKKLDLSNFSTAGYATALEGQKTNFVNNMFNGMTSLEKIKIPNSLAEIIALNQDSGFPSFYDADGTQITSESQLSNGGTFFKTQHTHTLKTENTATCTQAGKEISTCTDDFCDYEKQKDVPATGHTPDRPAAGCTTAQTCTVCHTELAPATGHTPGAAATCTKAQTCTECNTELAPANGHTPGAAATCTDPQKCTVCQAVIKNAKGHTPGAVATCTAPQTCTVCDAELKPATGHTAGAAATCTTAQTCTVCNTVLQNASGHTPGAAATCTTAQTCTNCNTELTAATGHDYQSVNGGVPPTCTTAGSGQIKCSRCGDEKAGSSIPALGHTEVVDPAAEATCTAAGKTEGKHCSVCNEVIVAQTDIPAFGHTEVVDQAVEATCTTAGKTEGKHCSVCDEVITAQTDVPALGHAYEWVITVHPTETETGLKKNICSRCQDEAGEEVIAKLVVDDSGSVEDLPPDNDYDLEIAVKESDSLYNIAGINKGYKVELYVLDGENRNPYDNTKTVTLMLVVPQGMEDNFALYCRRGDILEAVAKESYTVSGNIVTVRTTLPSEYVFNAPSPEPEPAGIPWWVWLLVILGAAIVLGIIIVIIVVARKKRKEEPTPPPAQQTPTKVVSVKQDNSEVIKRLNSQDKKIDKLIEISDSGFNDVVEVDEKGNIIKK